jgi:hypothetical protein
LLDRRGMACPHPCPSPRGEGSPSSARIRFSAAATSFLPGSEMPLALHFSAQLRQPGIQSRGRATTGLPVAGSQSKTAAGQKLRHSKSARHASPLMVGNQGNRSLRLRRIDTKFSPNLTRNRTGRPREALSGAFLWHGPVLQFFHAAGRGFRHSSYCEYPSPRNGLDRNLSCGTLSETAFVVLPLRTRPR